MLADAEGGTKVVSVQVGGPVGWRRRWPLLGGLPTVLW
jgi:hypothetical protein